MNRIVDRNMLIAFMLAPALLLGGTPPVEASSSGEGDQWNVNAALYIWYASIGGNTTTDSGVNVDASDLIDNLDSAFMGVIEVRNQDWSLMTDVIYLTVEADEQGTATLPSAPGVPVPVNANVDIEGWVVTLTAGPSLIETDQARLDLRFGARYLRLKSKLDLTSQSTSWACALFI